MIIIDKVSPYSRAVIIVSSLMTLPRPIFIKVVDWNKKSLCKSVKRQDSKAQNNKLIMLF